MANAPDNAFDRTPPQNIEAEISVLGGMLISKDAIADVVEILHPEDFYRPQHAEIFQTILDLFAKGEPADAVTVGAELARLGKLEQVGGLPYLHTLVGLSAHSCKRGILCQACARSGKAASVGGSRH